MRFAPVTYVCNFSIATTARACADGPYKTRLNCFIVCLASREGVKNEVGWLSLSLVCLTSWKKRSRNRSALLRRSPARLIYEGSFKFSTFPILSFEAYIAVSP